MKKLLLSLFLACGLSAMAQGGYQDGVDNYNAGRLDVAKVILNNTLNDASTDKGVAYYYLGCIDMNEKNIAEAKSNFEKGIQANSHNGYNLIGLGEIALRNGDKPGAEKYFKEAIATDKKNPALLVAVARAYFNVNPTLYAKEIDKNIQKALKDSKNTEAAAYILLGDMQAAEDPGNAAGQYEMAISQDQAKGNVNREAYVKYANTYFRVNPKFAISKLEELNKLEPNSALAQRELAEKYYDNEQFGSACLQYGKYMENPNHFQSDEQRYAGLLFSAGEHAKSLELAKKILAEDPENYFMERVVLLNHSSESQYSEAIKAAENLFNNPNAKLIPNDYILYAEALSGVGQDSAAIEIFKKAVELNPDKPELLAKLSQAYDKGGNPEASVETMKKYLELGNGSVNDIVNMARRYQSLARTLPEDSPERAKACDEGIKFINMAIEKVPENGTVYQIKAGLYITRDGLCKDAVDTYKKMVEVLDADPANKEKYATSYAVAYYMIGGFNLKEGDEEQAKLYYSKYADIAPDPDPAILKMLGRETE